jgi:hypothetical protein
MKTGAALDRSEQIKWWNAQDAFVSSWSDAGLEKAMELVRCCNHQDAQWLAALFPRGVAVTRDVVRKVMAAQGDDPRALYFSRQVCGEPVELMERSAERGYAPAQFYQSLRARSEESMMMWAQKSASQGCRRGIFRLGVLLCRGWGCAKDEPRGLALIHQAAELDFPEAQCEYGKLAFGELDWERFYWWSRAALRGCVAQSLYSDIIRLIPFLAAGVFPRVLHAAAPAVRKFVAEAPDCSERQAYVGLVALHDAMLRRARVAIHCWSIVGARLVVAKDVRVMIAKMAWDDAWRWPGK